MCSMLDAISALAMRLTNGIANGSLQRMLLGLVLVAITVAAAPHIANPASPTGPRRSRFPCWAGRCGW